MKKIFPLFAIFMLLGFGCQGGTTEKSSELIQEDYPLSHPDEEIAENLPTGGPYLHTVRSASSNDGLTWVDDREEDLVSHASVPTAVQMDDGTIMVYFVDAAMSGKERFGCIGSNVYGVFDWMSCEIINMTSPKAVDFSMFKLDDGRYRMYYYASDIHTDSLIEHNVDSAISDDGLTFVREGTVFTYPGLVDPDIFWTGEQWVLHSHGIVEQATVVATSADGLDFSYYGLLKPADYGVTKPVMLDDGTLRMYGFNQKSGQDKFYSFISDNGLDWQQEEGIRFEAEEGYQITDPFVIKLKDGSYKMFYKQSEGFPK